MITRGKNKAASLTLRNFIFPVKQALGGQDGETAGGAPYYIAAGMMATGNHMDKVKIFISYAHRDDSYRSELVKHLRIFEREGSAEIFDDRQIPPGSKWATEIDLKLEEAHIILFLLSADFIDSNYCYNKEMTRALELHELGQATVIPIVVRACLWNRTPLCEYQVLPSGAKPVEQWKYHDEAWADVAKGISSIVKERADFNRLNREKKMMAQAVQNVMNTMHQNAMNSIRNIRA